MKLDHLYGLKPWWEVARDIILMPREWFQEMFEYVRAADMIPLSSIHRVEDCRFLIDFGYYGAHREAKIEPKGSQHLSKIESKLC